jgi:hypothetical protein
LQDQQPERPLDHGCDLIVTDRSTTAGTRYVGQQADVKIGGVHWRIGQTPALDDELYDILQVITQNR